MTNNCRCLILFPAAVAAGILLAGCGGDSGDTDKDRIAPPKLTIAYSQEGSDGLNPEVQLSGILPSSLARKPLIDSLRASFPYPIDIKDTIAQKPGVRTPDWYRLLPGALPGLLAQTSSLTLAFDDRSLDVQGVSETEQAKEAVARDTVSAFSSAIDYANHRLRVERAKPRPSLLSIAMENTGSISLSGLVNDEATRTAIEAVLGRQTWHGAGVRITNGIEVRSYAEAPTWAEDLFLFLPICFDTPQERSLTISSDSVRLGGKVRSGQEKRSLVYAARRAFQGSNLPVSDALVITRLTEAQRRAVASRQSLSDFVARIRIYFDSGHHVIPVQELRKIQAVASKLAVTETGEKLAIVGLTDETGDPGTNKWIKDERCRAVYEALIDMGCDPSRLVLHPGDEGNPGADETPEQRRRVEFHVVASAANG